MDDTMPASPGVGTDSSTPYPAAIILATFSLLVALLIIPPMLWHLSNRNIGATSLIIWLLVLNLQSFLNAVLWSHDNIAHWFEGHVLCDIEVKISIAGTVGVPSSVACVLRALAKVMDTERVSLGLSKGQKRRAIAIDFLWCAGFPGLQMFFHYVVQTRRYYIAGIAGCMPANSRSWVTDLLITAPQIVWTVVGCYYAGEFGFLTSSFSRACRLTTSLQLLSSSACTATAATSPHCSPTATPTNPASRACSPSASHGF
jgi:pheromone a factor receptor